MTICRVTGFLFESLDYFRNNNIEINRIQYASDLYVEFIKNKEFMRDNPQIPNGDILILAGAILFYAAGDHGPVDPYLLCRGCGADGSDSSGNRGGL
jgi:hypothetical protein